MNFSIYPLARAVIFYSGRSVLPLICCSLAVFVLFGWSTATVAADVPNCASAASDKDGDGWGWENNRSCIVKSDVDSTQQQAQSSSIPVCSSSSVDYDGDGWGWENNRSCIVQSGVDSAQQQIQSSSIPFCSSTSADNDGDGWGWENGRTCIVGDNSSATAVIASSAPMPSTSNFDNCSSSASDDDGDGWGWENGRSCVVQQAQTTSEPNVPEPSQPVEATRPAAVRFMAVGDSITHGVQRDSAQSYRKPLVDLLESNNCHYKMLGSQSDNFGHSTFVSAHEGYNGYTADQLLYGHNGPAGQSEGISVIATRYQPEVMLLHIGTNDMRLGQNVEQTVAEIDQIINTFLSINPQSTVFVANLIPWYLGAQSQVQLLGDRIGSYVVQQADSRVRLVDVRAGYTLSMMLPDRVHPNPVGEAHMAAAFFRAIESRGFCR